MTPMGHHTEHCAECAGPIAPGDEHYPDPAACGGGDAVHPTGTPPVHPECCWACLDTAVTAHPDVVTLR